MRAFVHRYRTVAALVACTVTISILITAETRTLALLLIATAAGVLVATVVCLGWDIWLNP
ncbi:hypothetical protein [Nocardia sp. NPDC060249]|uniref:hypothetical protein n=1 Tax=Nocardia sp. NPDC060249 TaxID=3347082 RepID=UPI003659706A